MRYVVTSMILCLVAICIIILNITLHSYGITPPSFTKWIIIGIGLNFVIAMIVLTIELIRETRKID